MISGISVSVLIFLIIDFDWAAHRYLHPGIVEATFLSIPYFWFVIVGIFLGIAYYNFRHTKTGYRYQAYTVVLISFSVCLIIGGISYFVGAGADVDAIFTVSIPYYQYFVIHKEDLWMRPDKGLLSGVIRRMIENTQFELEDLKGKMWLVRHPDIELRGETVIEEGDAVKVIGERNSDDITFIAHEIKPWDGRAFRIQQVTAIPQ